MAQTTTPAAAAAAASVTGTVVDRSTGLPLARVAISISGTSSRAVSDANGHFAITIAPGIYTFEAAITGYQTTDSDTVTITANTATSITLALQRVESNAGNLREIGRTTTKASSALQAATVIQKQLSATDLLQSGKLRADDALRTLPNVVYTRGNALPGDDASIAIRGIPGGTITLIDGHPIDLPLNASALFPFQSINVLYGSGKGELYPVNALGGVVDLRTLAPTRLPTATLVESFGTFDHQTTGLQFTGTSGRFGFATSVGVEGIDAPYRNTVRYQPRTGFDPSATTGIAAARNFQTIDNPYSVKTVLLKAAYHLSDAASLTATSLAGAQIQTNVGDKSIDFIPYERAFADGTNRLTGRSSTDPCPSGSFSVTGKTAPGAKSPTPAGIGPDGQPDGGLPCQTPAQYASFNSGYGTGELGSIGTNYHFNDLKLEINGQHSRFVIDGYASLFTRSQDFESTNYYAVLGDLAGLHTKQTHDSRAGIIISEDLIFKNDQIGAGYYTENYRQNEIGVQNNPLLTNQPGQFDGSYLFSYDNATKSLFFRNVYQAEGSPLSIYAYDYIKRSNQPNAWFNDPRLAVLYRMRDTTFRIAAGNSSSLPYAPDNQGYAANSVSSFTSNLPTSAASCNAGNTYSVGSAATGFTKPERASDEEFAIGHRWKGDSTTQATFYSENFASKVIYGYNAPLTFTGTGFIDPNVLAQYQAAYLNACGVPINLQQLTLQGNYNLGRVLSRGLDITGRQRVGRNVFFDYTYGTQSVAFRSLPITVLQGNLRTTIGGQLITGDDGPTPLHTFNLALDANNSRGLDARITGYYTGSGNPQNLPAYTRTDLQVSQRLPGHSSITASVYNLLNYYGTYDKVVGFGTPYALNQFATANDYRAYFGAATDSSRFGIGPRTITVTFTAKSR